MDNRTAIFDALAAINATTASITYDGSGDSGQMNDAECDAPGFEQVRIAYEKAETVYVVKETGMYDRLVKTETVEMSLPDAISDFCWKILEDRHDGWENDDGGQGSFEFDVAERTVSFEHNEFYTSSNTSYYEV